MYEFFVMACSVVINGIPYLKDFMETLDLVKNNISRRDIDEFEKYIVGESRKIQMALSRTHMLSSGVSKKYVDVVIEEIKLFLPEVVKNKDEMCSQSCYQNMALSDMLWHEYCRLHNKNEFEEYEQDLKRGLFVVAEAWNEPPEESIRSCIEFLRRIESKSSNIVADVRTIKNDTKDIRQDVKSTDRKIEELYSGIEKMNGTVEDTNARMREMTQQFFFQGKSGEIQATGRQEEHVTEASEDDPDIKVSQDTSGQETEDAEEIPPDDIAICLAAAPDEFREEIDSLREFIEEQNHCQNAVRLTLRRYAGEALQDIRECQYCYMLVGARMEKWMQEAYELASRVYSDETCAPVCVKLHICFKITAGRKTLQAGDSGIEEWKNRYRKDFNRIPLEFHDINRIKLDIMQSLRAVAPEVNFSTRSIIQFRNNTEFGALCKKRDELQRQYEAAAQISCADGKRDRKLLEEELREQNDIIEKTEKEIWENLELLTARLQNRSIMDAREVEAIEDVIEYGDYSNAEKILRSRDWNEEVAALERSMQDEKEKLRQFISSQRTLIFNLKMKGISDGLAEEIIGIYERITDLSKEWHIEYITMYEFAEFLLNQRKYEKGIEVGEELRCLYGLYDYASAEEHVKLLKLLGDLCYYSCNYKNGEKYYREALAIFKKNNCDNLELRARIYIDMTRLLWKTNQAEQAERGLDKNIVSLGKLVETNPEIYEPVLAEAYNYRGVLANKRNQLDQAIEYHQKALEIRKRLAGKSSSYNYRPVMDLSITYNNLGFVYNKRKEYQKAQECYRKAIEIRSRNAKRNPSVFRPAMAVAYNNYATVLNIIGDNEKAQEMCEKSYRIRCELVKEAPSYKAALANTLHEYGIILTDAGEGMYMQAETHFLQAMEIREKLEAEDEMNEMTYGLQLAETYCCYGKLLVRMGDFPFDERCYRKAEELMKKACDKAEKYSGKNKGFDTDRISEIYYSFALFLRGRFQKHDDSERYYQKAIDGWRCLAKQCPQVFELRLKQAEKELEELREEM